MPLDNRTKRQIDDVVNLIDNKIDNKIQDQKILSLLKCRKIDSRAVYLMVCRKH